MNSSELWLPNRGMSFEHQYPTPDTEELIDIWTTYNPLSKVEPAPGVFGVVEPIDIERATNTPAIVSVDLCEVVRNTADSAMQILGQGVHDMEVASHYSTALKLSQDDVLSVIQLLMNEELVAPVAETREIRSMLRSWQRIGVFCVANTSTLPGCEQPTIKMLSENFNDCFNGILLPRNHDGTGVVTKGHATRFLVERYFGEKPLLALHIDDAPHHNESFAQAFQTLPTVEAKTFMPAYKGNDLLIDGSERTTTILESFELANDEIQKWRKAL